MSILFSIIVAVDQDSGIGKSGALPWRLSADMQHFKEITTTTADPAKKNAVIMGRKTWESLPPKFRPLPDRINVVVSRNAKFVLPDGVLSAQSLGQALAVIGRDLSAKIENVFVIGGAELYAAALAHPACKKIYLTKILHSFDCEVFFPRDLSSFKKDSESALRTEQSLNFVFQEYVHL